MLMQPMVFGWDAYYLPQWSFGFEEFSSSSATIRL